MIGYLLFGHVFAYPSHEEGWKTICRLCSSFNIDMDALKTAAEAQPLITGDYIVSASHILQAVAYYLCMERMVSLRQPELSVQLDEYLTLHFTENISTAALCERFAIGKTRLYEIVRKNYGVGLAEHIRHLRINKAKALLSETTLPLAEIAFRCGFRDYNYFITVFRHMEGMPPKQYQRTIRQHRDGDSTSAETETEKAAPTALPV